MYAAVESPLRRRDGKDRGGSDVPFITPGTPAGAVLLCGKGRLTCLFFLIFRVTRSRDDSKYAFARRRQPPATGTGGGTQPHHPVQTGSRSARWPFRYGG